MEHRLPIQTDIVGFSDAPVPEGENPYVSGAGPSQQIAVVGPSEEWIAWFDGIAERIKRALGWRAMCVEHVGSTAVPDLAAKPIIDIDLVVADPADEAAYVPQLEAAGFELQVREPWWLEHRMLALADPPCHLHVFAPASPEVIRHRILRDWLRGNPTDRARYEAAKRQASAESARAGEHMMEYNARKENTIRDIYHRAFSAMGLLDHLDKARR